MGIIAWRVGLYNILYIDLDKYRSIQKIQNKRLGPSTEHKSKYEAEVSVVAIAHFWTVFFNE